MNNVRTAYISLDDELPYLVVFRDCSVSFEDYDDMKILRLTPSRRKFFLGTVFADAKLVSLNSEGMVFQAKKWMNRETSVVVTCIF